MSNDGETSMTEWRADSPTVLTQVLPAKVYGLIPLIMAEVGAVKKARENKQQNYKFRGIDDFYNACQPVLAKHGVFIATHVAEQKREERQSKHGGTLIWVVLTVDHVFIASDGSSFTVRTVGEAMDSGDKATNKAMSAAMKYALVQTFCIPTDDPEVDTETQSHELEGRGPGLHGDRRESGTAPPARSSASETQAGSRSLPSVDFPVAEEVATPNWNDVGRLYQSVTSKVFLDELEAKYAEAVATGPKWLQKTRARAIKEVTKPKAVQPSISESIDPKDEVKF